MPTASRLEINLRKRQAGVYSLEFRYSEPGSEADIRLGPTQQSDIHLNLAELQFQIYNPEAYSHSLTQLFFADQAVRSMFESAAASSARLQIPMRVSLIIDQDCEELQGVYWELLRNPMNGLPLFLGENLYFSRYLSSTDWRKIQLRPKARLHALMLVANPADLSGYQGLEVINVDGEIDRARQGLGEIPITVLGKGAERASLNNLVAHLRDEKADILYIVCHGAMVRGDPYLWLEDESGKTDVTSAKELVECIQELSQLPLLVVLASCQSAGHESEAEFRSALGPLLAEAGVPAVVAMQGKISQETITAFMPVFFRALQEDGQVDRAMSLGRGRVRDQPDYWMPVLFSRLKSGLIFAEPEARVRELRIGWWSWAALAGLVLLGFGAVLAFMLWPKTRDMRIEERCSLCIAVAGFQQIGPAENNALGEDIGAELSGQLDKNLAELRNNTDNIIKVWGPNEIKSLAASDKEKLDLAAEQLAKNTGIDILVYGTIDTSKDSWRVEPRFIVSPRYYFKDLAEVIGQHELGSPFDVEENTEAAQLQQLKLTNSQRSRLLASIVMGETYMVLNDYDKALEVFQSVESDPQIWNDPAATKLVNLLLGNSAGRAYDPQNRPEMLDKAEDKYRKALAADPAYARAMLGLSSVAYARALKPTYQSADPQDIDSFRLLDIDELQKSLQYDQDALRSAEKPDLAHIQEKVAFGLGKIYFSRALFTAVTTMQDVTFQPAIDEFQKVIEAYQKNKDEVLKEIAAEAHANLGQIYSLTGELGTAVDHYRQALKLNHDPQREKIFQVKLQEVENQIAGNK